MTRPGARVLVLAVSLSEAQERRAHTAARLDALGLDFAFIDATDGRAEMPAGASPIRSLLEFGRAMTGPEVGCALSHAAAYERLIQSDSDVALILEDDLEIDDRLVDVVGALDHLRQGWDVLTLFHGRRARLEGPPRPIVSGVSARRVVHAFGTQGYALTAGAARSALAHLDPVRLPADELLFRPDVLGLSVFATTPPLVHDGAFDSVIRPSNGLAPTKTLGGRLLNKGYRTARGVTRGLRTASGAPSDRSTT